MDSFSKKMQEFDESLPPWSYHPSIYEHLKQHFDNETKCLADEGKVLPDEERKFKEGEIKWIAGGLDGAFGHHGPLKTDLEMVEKISSLVFEIVDTDLFVAKKELYQILLEDYLLDYLDSVLEVIENSSYITSSKLRSFALWLAQKTPDRGPVKFGIALLGILDSLEDLETILLLGKHEEFTLYAGMAVANMVKDPVPLLWTMAKSVKGWGRIHLVERIAQTDYPEIQAWLIREGYQNEVMHEYLAYICAVNGHLKEALGENVIDESLLDAAGDLILALIMGGPAQDINDYQEAAWVVLSYLKHLLSKAKKIKHYIIVKEILKYLEDEEWNWGEKVKNGWNESFHQTALNRARELLNQLIWEDLIQKSLASEDEDDFFYAEQAASDLKIDIWNVLWQRLEEKPFEAERWFQVMKQVNKNNIEKIVALALEKLPLEKVATGPAEKSGIGKGFQVHHCLDFILQGLGEFPSYGWPLIKIALQSEVIRNRNIALIVLSSWGEENWSVEVVPLLEKLLHLEPNQEVQNRIKSVLAGKPFL